MLKMITTLIRGKSQDAAETYAHANALPLLRQQMRDAAVAVKKSRQVVATAMASRQQEEARLEKINVQIEDLETRALAALEKGKETLATEAADAIAHLENEKAASEKALERYDTEISRLRADIRAAQLKLRDLERGQRLATATNYTQKLNASAPSSTDNSLHDAAETLAALEQRQQTLDATRQAEAELELSTAPEDIATRMAAQGLGKPLQSSADAVLERLKSKSKS